ncbi:SMC-Scp complex subunit ScpB [Lyngbya confervoides]|uniref:SMC-Scp complex subunit ScpB n=1 Tax=Lyngbya confervoides TaxID=207921 RepID=UPI0014097C05|nr:SMC-Scp complex subunit ScpB [Lyngbya confervoides]
MPDSDLINLSQLSTKLEAILYLKAQPLGLQAIAEYAQCEEEAVEEALLELMQDYAQRNSALEVVETDHGFSLQLREPYMTLVQTIVPTDLGVGALRTLAAIALRGPIPQTELVDLRGSGAYQHVGDLVEQGFVSKRRLPNGRSYTVQVTEKFKQYFEIDELPKLKLKQRGDRRKLAEDGEAVPPEAVEATMEQTGDPVSNEVPEVERLKHTPETVTDEYPAT